MEDVFHRVVMAEALEEGAVRVAAKRAESVELKNRGNALVAEQQWKAALDTYNMVRQAAFSARCYWMRRRGPIGGVHVICTVLPHAGLHCTASSVLQGCSGS